MFCFRAIPSKGQDEVIPNNTIQALSLDSTFQSYSFTFYDLKYPGLVYMSMPL